MARCALQVWHAGADLKRRGACRHVAFRQRDPQNGHPLTGATALGCHSIGTSFPPPYAQVEATHPSGLQEVLHPLEGASIGTRSHPRELRRVPRSELSWQALQPRPRMCREVPPSDPE